MRKTLILVLAILLSCSVMAIVLPGPPNPPPTEIPDVLMVLGFDNNTVSPFDVNVSHTGSKPYLYCELQIDALNVTNFFSLDKDEVAEFTLDASLGNHILTGLCANDSVGSDVIRADVNFKIVTDASDGEIFITSPADEDVVESEFDVVMNHTAPSSRSCHMELYDEDTMGDVFFKKKSFVLSPNTRKTVTFGDPDELEPDDYLIRTRCQQTSGIGIINATDVVVTVEDDSGSSSGGDYAVVLMDPKEDTIYDDDFDVRFFHNATSRANCSVSIDNDEKDSIENLLSRLPKTFDYDLWQGVFDIAVTCTNQTWSAEVEFALEIDLNESTNNTNNDTNVNNTNTTNEGPVVSISGKTGIKPNVTEGVSFTILGEFFTPRDTVKLWISGGGVTHTDSTLIGTDGKFSYVFTEDLKPGTFRITARNQNHTTEYANLNFLVVRDKTKDLGWDEKDDDTTTTTGSTTGSTTSGSSGNTNTGTTGNTNRPTGSTPFEENPAPVDEGGGWFIWVLIPFLAFVIVTGGLIGFLAYRGDLDLTSWDAFQTSFQEIIGTSPSKSSSAKHMDVVIPPDEKNTIKSFVGDERGKGFDDLTIRSALIARGWDKSHVDSVFDEMYKGGQNAK